MGSTAKPGDVRWPTPQQVARVVLVGADGRKVLDLVVPPADARDGLGAAPEIDHTPGWQVTDRLALYDGRPVPVTGRKRDVLRVLASQPVASAAELRKAWDGYQVEDSTVRWTVGELKKALKEVFPDFPGNPVVATGEGYALTLR